MYSGGGSIPAGGSPVECDRHCDPTSESTCSRPSGMGCAVPIVAASIPTPLPLWLPLLRDSRDASRDNDRLESL